MPHLLLQERPLDDSEAVLEDESDEGASIETEFLPADLHRVEDIQVETDASADGAGWFVVFGHDELKDLKCGYEKSTTMVEGIFFVLTFLMQVRPCTDPM